MDTTRADRCGFNGYARPTTPRLDAFAKDAMVFRETWSPSNWTGPAHASLFSGLSPQHHGFTLGTHVYLPGDVPVLAERFLAAGYGTACFTNNNVVSPEFGLVRGFAKFEAEYVNESRPYPYATETHERALDWAEASHAAGRPFFLFINDMEPHETYAPPEDVAREFIRGTPSAAELADARKFAFPHTFGFDLGLEKIPEQKLALLSDLYDGEIRTLDREIGVLLDRLKKSGLYDSTVLVILGDHGEYFGEHHFAGHATGLYRQVLHVPMILRFPGVFDGGRVATGVTRLEDVAPTLLEVCGLPPLPAADGEALTRNLTQRVASAVQRPNNWASDISGAAFPGADLSRISVGIESVFDGGWHLLMFSDGRRELYDVELDPEEEKDIQAKRPDVVDRLAGLLAERRRAH